MSDWPENRYIVWCPSLGQTREHAQLFEAFDAEHAATQWACRADQDLTADAIFRGMDITVCVVPTTGPPQALKVLVQGQRESAYIGHLVTHMRDTAQEHSR